VNLFYIDEAGDKGAGRPFPLHPKSPPKLLRFAPDNLSLTIPNTSSTITLPASLRSDCCSPSLRNAVRLPSGIDVHLHRNTHAEERFEGLSTTARDHRPITIQKQRGTIWLFSTIFLLMSSNTKRRLSLVSLITTHSVLKGGCSAVSEEVLISFAVSKCCQSGLIALL
jgi:hypothetical protein